jgi:hypothetical protein
MYRPVPPPGAVPLRRRAGIVVSASGPGPNYPTIGRYQTKHPRGNVGAGVRFTLAEKEPGLI